MHTLRTKRSCPLFRKCFFLWASGTARSSSWWSTFCSSLARLSRFDKLPNFLKQFFKHLTFFSCFQCIFCLLCVVCLELDVFQLDVFKGFNLCFLPFFSQFLLLKFLKFWAILLIGPASVLLDLI